jgi:hypothetical protein
MLFSALQTKGVIAINCQLSESSPGLSELETLWVDCLIVNEAQLVNTIQILVPTFADERDKGTVRVRIPNQTGLYKDETLEVFMEV